MQLKPTLFAFIVLLVYPHLPAQDPTYRVDEQGRIVFTSDGSEVTGFGVNYTVPFAHAYRNAKKLGFDPRRVIDQDVYHFARLGFDLYRVHVWDVEISDTAGNLLENERLETLDYLLKQLSDRGIRYVLTPIAYWGNGWPEPDRELPGFSSVYGKGECLTNPDCIEAQENYLYQFMNHVNEYTGVAYKDDPNLIAVEISNEPHHKGEGSQVTAFVSRMVQAVKRSGCRKPVFYNTSHGVHFAEDYFEGGIDGGTFQWYPTGLGYQRELPGNVLPNVDRYEIPFDSTFTARGGAKIVYEFDPADVMDAHVYPAMARSFRTAGIQLATHFSYDPTFLAPYNTEYNTHFMNLSYTPAKALALSICARIFKEVPRYASYGKYPENLSFGNIVLDDQSKVAVYNSEDTFIHTGDTDLTPWKSKKLRSIAGVGGSAIVDYAGSGAYFLDRVTKGIWRLEVMPDPVLIDNPFGRNSLKKQRAGIRWGTHPIEVRLGDLGEEFTVEAISVGNPIQKQKAERGAFRVTPGTYLLTGSGRSFNGEIDQPFANHRLNDFYAPPANLTSTGLLHQSKFSAPTRKDRVITARVWGPEAPKSVELEAYLPGNKRLLLEMKSQREFLYTATIPGDSLLTEGPLNYFITIRDAQDKVRTFPGDVEGRPGEWDFDFGSHYRTQLFTPESPVLLFEAQRDYDRLIRPWRRGVRLRTDPRSQGGALEVNLNRLWRPDSENRFATPIEDYTLRHPLPDFVESWKSLFSMDRTLVVDGHALNDTPCRVQIGLVMDNGLTYGKTLLLSPEDGIYRIPLIELVPVKTVLLPRPYPGFLPYYFESGERQAAFDPQRVEAIQISLGPGMSPTEIDRQNGYAIRRILIE